VGKGGFPPEIKTFNWTDYKAIVEEQYQIFCNDFITSTVMFQGKPIVIKPQPTTDGKEDCFWHVVSRDFDGSGTRDADGQRVARVHWLRAIVENFDHPTVTYFTYQTAKGRYRHYFWLKESSYLLILEEGAKRYYIVTAYIVDKKYMIEDLTKRAAAYVLRIK